MAGHVLHFASREFGVECHIKIRAAPRVISYLSSRLITTSISVQSFHNQRCPPILTEKDVSEVAIMTDVRLLKSSTSTC